MKITVVNGSPRGANGTSYRMLEGLFEVIKEKSYELNYIELASKKINHCTGCFSCWFQTPGKCVINDDVNELLESMRDSDYIVYACPLYVDNITGLLKNFLDRCIPNSNPRFEKDENGEAVHLKRYKRDKKLKIIAISNCGFPEQSHFEVLKVLYRRMARNMKAELSAEIYKAQGPLLKVDNVFVKMLTTPYYSNLKKAYREIFEQGGISTELQKKLDSPLLPIDDYYKRANDRFDELEKKALENTNGSRRPS